MKKAALKVVQRTMLDVFRFIQKAERRNKKFMSSRGRALRADVSMGSDGWHRPAWKQYKVPVRMFRNFILRLR